MPKRFTKKCVCHGTPGLVRKAHWKSMRRLGSKLACERGVLEPRYILFPYIPLQEAVIP